MKAASQWIGTVELVVKLVVVEVVEVTFAATFTFATFAFAAKTFTSAPKAFAKAFAFVSFDKCLNGSNVHWRWTAIVLLGSREGLLGFVVGKYCFSQVVPVVVSRGM